MSDTRNPMSQPLPEPNGVAHAGAAADLDPDLSISLKFTWINTLPVLLALAVDGKGEAFGFARVEFQRMAATADLCNDALSLLATLAETGEYDAALLTQLVTRAARLASSGNLPVGAVRQQRDETKPPARYGLMAALTGQQLPLEVLYSAAGWYIGTCLNDMPYSRESVEYWPKRELATQALEQGGWTQKQNP